MPPKKFYAVRIGRVPGVYSTWEECEKQVKGFSDCSHKSFRTEAEAWSFVNEGQGGSAAAGSFLASASSAPHGASQAAKSQSEETAVKKRKNQTTNTQAASDSAQPPSPKKKKETEIVPRRERLVYTDGASKNNGRPDAAAGYGVYWGDGDPHNVSARLRGSEQTNNRAELTAIVEALRQSKALYPEDRIILRTDSQYSMKCVTEWMPKWVRNGFMTAMGHPVKNQDLIMQLHALMQERGEERLDLQWVKGHSSEEGNEAADSLADAGCFLPLPSYRERHF
mmetsp:Transcript_49558/g.97600  ORF Transcript_49558/g.97600 Transcript_49558/m.97600 type:complete len:281 (+) Transcript_49558:445-1287(+)